MHLSESDALEVPDHFPWVVRDGRFLLGWPARSAEWWMVRDLFSRVMNRIDYPGNMNLEIIELAPNHIILRQQSGSLDVTLTRIPN